MTAALPFKPWTIKLCNYVFKKLQLLWTLHLQESQKSSLRSLYTTNPAPSQKYLTSSMLKYYGPPAQFVHITNICINFKVVVLEILLKKLYLAIFW